MAGRSGPKQPWAALYKTAGWRTLRRRQLQREPLCCLCDLLGITKAAEIVDHKRPHKGNPALFFDATNLQSLCKPHHDRTKQSWEKRGTPEVGADGWPVEGT